MWTKIKKNIIFSVSGWRAILSNENTSLVSEDYLCCFYYGIKSYILAKEQNRTKTATQPLRIAIGADSRLSGIMLIELAKKIVIEHHCEAQILGLIPGPAIMSYTKSHADGFVYFTASHNPSEYNGIKFGSHEGKVQSKEEYIQMMNIFESMSEKYSENIPLVIKELQKNSVQLPKAIEDIEIDEDVYALATQGYKDILFESVFKGLENPEKTFLEKYAIYQKTHKKLGVVMDPNGGARSWAFDTEILQSLGIECDCINNKPSVYTHPIIPEGKSLNLARNHILKKNKKTDDVFWPIAVVTDCDGDRGNTIFVSQSDPTESHSLSAQEVCLSVLQIELAWQSYIKQSKNTQVNTHTVKPIAVAFNGPSSLRADIIAKRYSALLFRGEVGEANIVSLGEQLVKEGYDVPMVGEASNGGVIIFPSTVRDPLCSILSFLKGILWADELNLSNDILSQSTSLPTGHSTETEDSLAKFSLPDLPYPSIAKKILTCYASFHQEFTKTFHSYGIKIAHYTFRNYDGSKSKEDSSGNPFDVISGGLAISFYSAAFDENIPIAFVWLRPSGTEPVVRLMADVCHDDRQLERDLIKMWRAYLQNILHDSH